MISKNYCLDFSGYFTINDPEYKDTKDSKQTGYLAKYQIPPANVPDEEMAIIKKNNIDSFSVKLNNAYQDYVDNKDKFEAISLNAFKKNEIGT